jgi:hypothetical protein
MTTLAYRTALTTTHTNQLATVFSAFLSRIVLTNPLSLFLSVFFFFISAVLMKVCGEAKRSEFVLHVSL